MDTPTLNARDVEAAVEAAVAEDFGKGDITTKGVVPPGSTLKLNMVARQDMVVCGLPVAKEVFYKFAPDAHIAVEAEEGQEITKGTVMMRLDGAADGLLTAERTALNFVQFLSGIATLTRQYVQAIKGTGAVLLDTRKTVPGLRYLSKYATAVGGAQNHRMRLDDGVLIKDNHIAVCGSVSEAVTRAKKAPLHDIEVECDTLDQVKEAIDAGARRILLDNMPIEQMKTAVMMASANEENGREHKIPVEASGGVTLQKIRDIAETGVDFISVGRITQSAPAVDIGLDRVD